MSQHRVQFTPELLQRFAEKVQRFGLEAGFIRTNGGQPIFQFRYNGETAELPPTPTRAECYGFLSLVCEAMSVPLETTPGLTPIEDLAMYLEDINVATAELLSSNGGAAGSDA